MASGKLTPRQKMINLMYLVLTALLALNVSKDILDSLQTLAASLRKSAEVLDEKNLSTIGDIEASIKKEAEKGNKNNLYLLPLLEEIQKKDKEIYDFMEGHINMLKKLGQYDSTINKLAKPDEVENNFRYLMKGKQDELANGGRGAGAAKDIHDKLDEFIVWANTMYYKLQKKSPPSNLKQMVDKYSKIDNPEEKKKLKAQGLYFPPIVIEPKGNPSITNPDDKRKTWELYTFDHNTPVIANIAVLEKLKSDIAIVVSELIETARRQLMQVTFKIDSLMAIDAPESKYVIVGMKFKTRLFVAMSSSQIKPKFSSGSGQIKVKAGGNEAELIIRARRPGKVRYTATIRVPKADGSEAILPVKGEFFVRKPEIVVTSRSVSILYAHCANDVTVDVPALGELYNPVIKARGGKAIVSPKNKKAIRIVPTAKKLLLIVSSRTGGELIKIGTLTYQVIQPPKPTIVVYENGKKWDGEKPWKKGSKLKITVVPDKDFGQNFVKDARYVIKGAVVKVKKGLGSAVPVKTLGNSRVPRNSKIHTSLSFSLASVTRGLPRGAKIFVQMEDIFRVNFAGKHLKENFSRRELTISGVVE